MIGRLLRVIYTALREIFDERAFDRFSARRANANFNEFLRERHDRPRQRCC